MTKKTLSGICSVLVAGIVAAGVCCAGYASRNDAGKWFKNSDISTWHWSDEKVDIGETETNNATNSMQLSKVESRGAKFSTRALATSEYEEYEIDAQSIDNAHVATVTLANHKEATDKSLTLTATFEDDEASNLNVSDYISLSSTTVQSGEEFTITCLQPFAYPITITATANGVQNGEKPSCSIQADYVRRFKKLDLSFISKTRISQGASLLGESILVTLSEPTVGQLLPQTDITADFDSYASEKWSSGKADSIYIESYMDNEQYTSIGTVCERINNVKITFTGGNTGNPVFDNVDALNNSYAQYANSIGPYFNYPLFLLFYDYDYVNSLDKKIQSYMSGYQYASELYARRGVTATMWIQFTGEKTGITYTFGSNLIVNPKYMYVAAQSPSFDSNTSGGIIF